MEYDIDDDLIEDACELEQDQRGDAAHMFPDDPNFSSEPAAALSTLTRPSNKPLNASSLATQGGSLLQETGGARHLDALTPAPGSTAPHVNAERVRSGLLSH